MDFTCSCRSKDTESVFITKWLPQLIKKLPWLIKKLIPQEKSFHSRGNQPLIDECLLLKSYLLKPIDDIVNQKFILLTFWAYCVNLPITTIDFLTQANYFICKFSYYCY